MGFDEAELEQVLHCLYEEIRTFMMFLEEHDCTNFECFVDDIKVTLHKDPKYLQPPEWWQEGA
jgi:hypothetical protein